MTVFKEFELDFIEEMREVLNSGDIIEIKVALSKFDTSFRARVLLAYAGLNGYTFMSEVNKGTGVARLYFITDKGEMYVIHSGVPPIRQDYGKWDLDRFKQFWANWADIPKEIIDYFINESNHTINITG